MQEFKRLTFQLTSAAQHGSEDQRRICSVAFVNRSEYACQCANVVRNSKVSGSEGWIELYHKMYEDQRRDASQRNAYYVES